MMTRARVCGWTFLFCRAVNASRLLGAVQDLFILLGQHSFASSLSSLLSSHLAHNLTPSQIPQLSLTPDLHHTRPYPQRVRYDQHVNNTLYAATFTNYQPPALSSNPEHCRSSNSTAQHCHSPGS